MSRLQKLVLPFDIRLEVLLARLSEDNEYSNLIDRIVIRPIGIVNRAVPGAKEIVNIASDNSQDIEEKALCFIDVRREGLFDTLPEKLFISDQSTKNLKEDLSRNAKEREDARTFFLPFEQTFFQFGTQLEHWEKEYFEGIPKVLLDFWNLNKYQLFFTKQQLKVLLKLLPLAYYAKGDINIVQACFEAIIGKRIVIVAKRQSKISIPTKAQAILGFFQLGGKKALGETIKDRYPEFEIQIHNVDYEELVDLLKNEKLDQQIQLVKKYFFSYEIKSTTRIYINKKDRFFRLGNSERKNILSLTTWISG